MGDVHRRLPPSVDRDVLVAPEHRLGAR
jgi:hypothetical protein